jgi:hypothetical protein
VDNVSWLNLDISGLAKPADFSVEVANVVKTKEQA